MKRILLIIAMTFFSPFSHAQIFHCTDDAGRAIFKDKECDVNEKLINTLSESPNEPEIDENNPYGGENIKPGEVIYENKGDLLYPDKIKINEVRLVTETFDVLVVDLIYTYELEVSAEEMQIFITPNHRYWRARPIQVSKGKNVGRASISLSRSNMKKDHVTTSRSDSLHISFDHYTPGEYIGAIWTVDIPFKKYWRLKK